MSRESQVSKSDSSSQKLSGSSGVLYILLCLPDHLISHTSEHKQLRANIALNDGHFFRLLKDAYKERQGRFDRCWNFNTVTQVAFSHFLLSRSNRVEVKLHDTPCEGSTSKECQCNPPLEKLVPSTGAEYSCEPVQPQFSPPIGHSHLTHLCHHPECLDDGEIEIISQFPKRLAGPLMAVNGGKRLPGWGLPIEDGYDQKAISAWLAAFTVLSFIFGVVWVSCKDIQGGFTITACFVSTLVVIFGYFIVHGN